MITRTRYPKIVVALLVACTTASFVSGQMARKPSPSRNTTPISSTSPDSERFLPAIQTQADFDLLARVYNAKTPYALPHLMFVIDRRNDDKIYFVNSKMFRFHQDFANAMYLSLKRG